MVVGGLRDRLEEMEAEVEEGAAKFWRPPSPCERWHGPLRRPPERPQGAKFKIPRRAPDVPPSARPAGVPLPSW